nr:aminoacyl-histidine dipeptidase [Endozoicomonas sp.]
MDITTRLANVDAASVWHHFRNIAGIPHPSGHEEALCQYIINVAGKKQLKWKQDKVGNLVVYKPGTAGYETSPVIILQSHLDMVPEKTRDSLHDFRVDGIQLKIDGEWLIATDTTLGADNGIGVAAMLAVLESSDVCHGPLEALFTVTEETTMAGAQGLDPSLLSGTVLLNLDTEEDGSLYIGCAGGVNIEVRHECAMEPAPHNDHQWFELQVSGLQGGHSGCDIHFQRANAIQVLARVLKTLHPFEFRLSHCQGGVLDNAIPREASAVIGLPADRIEKALQSIDNVDQLLKRELSAVEPDICLTFEPAVTPAHVFTASDQKQWLNALHSCHHGVKRYSDHFAGVVETSNNLGVLSMKDGLISVDCFTRSLVDSATVELADNISGLFSLTGVDVRQVGFFPGWKPNPNSDVLKRVSAVYQQLNGEEPEIKIIHAALECGILSAAKPGLDMISFGPQIENA